VLAKDSTCRSAKTKQDKPIDSFTKGSSAGPGGHVIESAKTDHSIEHTFSRATSAPEGLPKFKNAFSRASSVPSGCAQDAELCALETLETLQYVVSSGAGYGSYQIPRIGGPHTGNLRRADKFVVDNKNSSIDADSIEESEIPQLSRHHSLPMSNTSVNVDISQDLIDRSSERKTFARRTSSAESRGTSQMVAFCETERLKARSSSAKTHSGMENKHPAKSSDSPQFIWAFKTFLPLVLCVLFVIILWTLFFAL